MVIDGKKLAETVHEETRAKLEALQTQGIHPTIAIVTVGPEVAWEAYVGQKIKFAERFGIEKKLITLKDEDESVLHTTVKTLNDDPTVTGIIVQRPLPTSFDQDAVTNLISPQKDIDGFRKDSKHQVPVFLAVKRILEEANSNQTHSVIPNSTHTVIPDSDPGSNKIDSRRNLSRKYRDGNDNVESDFLSWLQKKNVVVIGKGESAGKLIIKGLYDLDVLPKVIDSKTKKPELIEKEADVIICCAGKKVIKSENLKKGVILVGVGIDRGENNKLFGDYDEEEIKDIASFYTPTPGGVGPLNLAYLFNNLVNTANIHE